MPKRKDKLEIGKFYYAYWGTKHPAFIYEYDGQIKIYKAIIFGTSWSKHMTKVHSLTGNRDTEFVRNRPFEGVRSDFGDKELVGFRIDERDYEIIENIKNKETKKSKKAKARYKKMPPNP